MLGSETDTDREPSSGSASATLCDRVSHNFILDPFDTFRAPRPPTLAQLSTQIEGMKQPVSVNRTPRSIGSTTVDPVDIEYNVPSADQLTGLIGSLLQQAQVRSSQLNVSLHPIALLCSPMKVQR